MSRFFPPTLTSERRGEIIVFKQGEDESLYNAWERYKRLLKRCPMHGIDLTNQMDIFYHSMNVAPLSSPTRLVNLNLFRDARLILFVYFSFVCFFFL